MKFKNYWKPTPKKLKQLGDSFLAVSGYAQAQEMFTGQNDWLTVISIVGLIGKFLTNFFTNEK